MATELFFRKRLRRALSRILVKLLILTTRLLPRKSGLRLFSRIGLIACRIYSKERKIALKNTAVAFPDMDPVIRDAFVKASFSALGKNVYDALRLNFTGREDVLALCDIEGEENIAEPYKSGRGVIALTGHIGCWELMAAYMSHRGYRVSVIAQRLPDRVLNEWLVRLRERHGLKVIQRGMSAISAMKVLKRGEVLGVLIDQDIDVDGMFVPFFGAPAFTPIGTALLALKTGAAIVPMAIHMEPDGRHRIVIMEELEHPPQGLVPQERIRILTERCSLAVEKLVRLYPQQWVWFHDRWKKAFESGIIKTDENGKFIVDVGAIKEGVADGAYSGF